MSKEQNFTEYDFDFNYITSFFTKMNCLGPGSKECTEKAASFIPIMNDDAKIADFGCGTGRQTIDLANCVKGNIHAIDISAAMVEKTEERIAENAMQERVFAEEGSMDNPKFREEQFDIIWAEGSIYHIGFEKGLNIWQKFLKRNGFIALTECCWITEKRPEDKEWLEENFIEIDSIENKIKIIEKEGFKVISHFILTEDCWIDNYYNSMEGRIEEFLDENNHDGKSIFFTNMLRYEMDFYKRNKEFYGYVFFIMRKL